MSGRPNFSVAAAAPQPNTETLRNRRRVTTLLPPVFIGRPEAWASLAPPFVQRRAAALTRSGGHRRRRNAGEETGQIIPRFAKTMAGSERISGSIDRWQFLCSLGNPAHETHP